MNELLEGIRRGRIVHIFKAWSVSDVSREERMHMFDLRPRWKRTFIIPNPTTAEISQTFLAAAVCGYLIRKCKGSEKGVPAFQLANSNIGTSGTHLL